jgi:hypothetical protein
MYVWLIKCNIGGWGYDVTLQICDSKETADFWLATNINNIMKFYKNTYEDDFDVVCEKVCTDGRHVEDTYANA